MVTNPATSGLCGRSVFDDIDPMRRFGVHRTYRWCWTCGLRRVAPWAIDEHQHARRLPCGCTTTEED